jgi:hypothetical protein
MTAPPAAGAPMTPKAGRGSDGWFPDIQGFPPPSLGPRCEIQIDLH